MQELKRSTASECFIYILFRYLYC